MSKFSIAAVGVDIPGFSDNCKSIYSMESLSPYDIIVFRPELHSYEYSSISFSNGGSALTGDGYKDFVKQSNHWVAELNDALKLKKTIIVLITPNEEIIYSTGYSSPRKGEKVYTTSKDNLYNYLLPFNLQARETNGKSIYVCKNDMTSIIKQIYDSCKEHTAYEVVFTEIDKFSLPLLMTKSNQIVGFLDYYQHGGRLLFWPNIDFEYEGSIYEDEEAKTYWTDEAMAMGKAFITAVVSLHKSFQCLQEPAPEWVLEKIYMSNTEKDILAQIESNKDKQKKLEKEVIKLQGKLQQEQQLKPLLYAQGKELEIAVNYALSILGLKVKNYHFKKKDFEIDNLIDYNGNIIIGETEGKDKDAIAVGKIRQLITNKDEYYIEEIENQPIEPKGILFGNPERLRPLAKRSLDFTNACKQLSRTKKIALVRTQDLFDVVFYLMNNPNETDFSSKCIEAMLNTESEIVDFPKQN